MRERLLDAATAIAAEHGFETSALRDIAARAGVSPAMVAYYFGDRRGLYEAMFERAFERLGEQVATLLDDGESASDTLDGFVRLHVAALAADPWIPQLIAREVLSRETPLRARFAEQVGAGPLAMLVAWIEGQQRAGALRGDLDARLVAISLAGLAAFPFLIVPILGERIGLRLDDALSEQLIEHNQKLLATGLRAPQDGSEGTS